MAEYCTEEVKTIVNYACEMSKDYGHEWCDTSHLFMAIVKFLKLESNQEAYKFKLSNGNTYIKEIINNNPKKELSPVKKNGFYYLNNEPTEIPSTETIKEFSKFKKEVSPKIYTEFANEFVNLLMTYNITQMSLKAAFSIINPKVDSVIAEDKDIMLTYKADFSDVCNKMADSFSDSREQQDVLDLVNFIFSDKNYLVYNLIQIISEMSETKNKYEFSTPIAFTPSDFYNEVYGLVEKYKIKQVCNKLPDLEKIPQLSNINKEVSKKPVLTLEADETIDKIEIQLNSEEFPCLVLVGNSGVGKTAMVRELAQRINNKEVSPRLLNKVIYELNINDLLAGTKFRGDFEQKCKKIFEVCKKNPNAILFIDEGHMIAKAGSSGSDGGDVTLGNIIKPYISKGEVTIITATTDGEYKFIEKDKALCSRFQKIAIQEPTNETTTKIMEGVIKKKEHEYGINTSEKDQLIKYILREGYKFLPNESNPKRSLKLLDGAFAYASKNDSKTIEVSDLKKYIISQYGLTISDNKAQDTKKKLKKELLGQDAAINRICENLEICELGLSDPKKPMYSMILAGPTGTGKTHAAKAIAKYFFGNENNVVSIDMTQYREAYTVSNLIGAAKSYEGYSDEPALICGIKQKPNSVVIFDEIEKAHEDIFQVFLKILDEGELDDAHGGKVSFRNAIIIFTTNLGFDQSTGKPSGAGLFKETIGSANALPAIKKAFRPEFLARIDDIVIYNYLPENIVRDLIYRNTNEILDRAGIKMDVKYTEEEIKEISRLANVTQDGARNIAKNVQRVLAKKILKEREVIA